MQEISVKKFWDNLDIRYKITFFSAMIWGVVSHGMALFQKLSFHDDNVALFGVGATYNLGRWMLGLISKFERILFGDSHYSLPVFNGFMALLLIAFSACLIVNMLEIKNEFSCALIGGLMVCFPAVTSIFGYLFTLHYYMLAMALGVLGVYCICKGNRWYCTLLGIVLMTCSIGIYQAFLPLMLSVMLLYFIHAVVADQYGVSGIFTCIVKWVGSTIGALVLYFGFNKLFLNLTSSELSSYRGISAMGGTRPLDYLIRIFSAYREFFQPSREGVYNMYPGNVRGVFYLILLTAMIMAVILLFRLWKTQKYKAIFCGLAFLIFPLCSNFIFVMTEEKDIHSLMVYSHLMCFILFVWLIEHVKICRVTIRRAFMTVCLTAMVLLNVMYCRWDNKCYLKATIYQQQAISYFTTLVTRIKSAENYKDEFPVVFVNRQEIQDQSLKEFPQFEDVEIYPYAGIWDYVNDYAWQEFMRIWCGYAPEIIESEVYEGLPEIKEMTSYPDDGSIKVIDQTVVVKF